jgi:hypothetical protein
MDQSSRVRAAVGIAIELRDQQSQALSETGHYLHVSETDVAAVALRILNIPGSLALLSTMGGRDGRPAGARC